MAESAVLGRYVELIPVKGSSQAVTTQKVHIVRSDGKFGYTKDDQRAIPLIDLLDVERFQPSTVPTHGHLQAFAQQVHVPLRPDPSTRLPEPEYVPPAYDPNFNPQAPTYQAPPAPPVYQAPVAPAKNYSTSQNFVESAIEVSRKKAVKNQISVTIPLTIDFDINIIKTIAEQMGVGDQDLATVISDNINLDMKEVLNQISISVLGIELKPEVIEEPEPEVIEAVEAGPVARPTVLIKGDDFTAPLTYRFLSTDGREIDGDVEGASIQFFLTSIPTTRQLIGEVREHFGATDDFNQIQFIYEVEMFEGVHYTILMGALNEIREEEATMPSEGQAVHRIQAPTQQEIEAQQAQPIEQGAKVLVREGKPKPIEPPAPFEVLTPAPPAPAPVAPKAEPKGGLFEQADPNAKSELPVYTPPTKSTKFSDLWKATNEGK